MAREITIPYGNEKYTLAYSLDTVRTMEQAGFVIEEVATKPAVRIPELFYGSFIKNHRGIKRKMVEEIYKNLNRKDELVTALAELYREAQSSLIDEGNVDWTISE